MQPLGPTLFWLGVVPFAAAFFLPDLLLGEPEPPFAIRAGVFVLAVPLSIGLWWLTDRLRGARNGSRSEPRDLTIHDVIRMNQLVRGEIRMQAFRDWFDSEDEEGQFLILRELVNFAYQIGGGRDRYVNAALARCESELGPELAAEFAGLRDGWFPPPEDPAPPFPKKLKSALSNPPHGRDLHDWLHEASPLRRAAAFPFFVYLFGLAEEEGRCRDMEQCTHWWHRDLLDDDVVAEILRELGESSTPGASR